MVAAWKNILSRAVAANVAIPPEPKFTFRLGSNLRVYFGSSGTDFRIPWLLAAQLAQVMLGFAENGMVGPFDVMLGRGGDAIHVVFEVLYVEGVGDGELR